ncbi:GNAT family N-acetyltransferase [Solitalea lacus]|uniref:GNAT family N-acetyltransferase n=1 Tax=Solitalea lacus TaxID=2911172 RepID=UPI001EDC14EA|nr:GNAT family N-acetyltransferase [Solitalea lacus]UKJ08056.1 GNAT family N-acetyltransferase [Solitalea lacus]
MIVHRLAKSTDVDLYFKWANEDQARKNSYSQKKIDYQTHVNWFNAALKDENSIMLVFEYETGMAIGQIRFERHNSDTIVRISIDKDFRGRLLAKQMIMDACDYFFNLFPGDLVRAYIRKENMASVRAFEHSGFEFEKETTVNEIPSFVYTKRKS